MAHLRKNWLSVSAAAAMLLGLNRADAHISDELDIAKAKPSDGDPDEPLVLKPASVRVIPEMLFAGHR